MNEPDVFPVTPVTPVTPMTFSPPTVIPDTLAPMFHMHDLEKLYEELTIAANLRENERLNTQGSQLSVVRPSDFWTNLYNSLRRWASREDRSTNLDTLNRMIDRTFNMLDQLIRQREQLLYQLPLQPPSLQIIEQWISNAQWTQRLMQKLKEILTGLANLTITYDDDHTICGYIKSLRERTGDRLLQKQALIQFLQQKTEELETLPANMRPFFIQPLDFSFPFVVATHSTT